jgi:hypothetical protein
MNIKTEVAKLIGADNLKKLYDLLPKEVKLSGGDALKYTGELKKGVEVKLYSNDGRELVLTDGTYKSDKHKIEVKQNTIVSIEDVTPAAGTPAAVSTPAPATPVAQDGLPPATTPAPAAQAAPGAEGAVTVESLAERIAALEAAIAAMTEQSTAMMSGIENSFKAVKLMAEHIEGAPAAKGGENDLEDFKQFRRNAIIALAKN